MKTGNGSGAKKQIQLTVTHNTELLELLRARLVDWSRSKVKSILTHGQVTVDGEIIRQFDHPLTPGAKVIVNRYRTIAPDDVRGVKILFEDNVLIVIEKEAGLLSVGSEKEKNRTAFRIVSDHVKKSRPRGRIYTVHRLDREASGVMLFAKTKQAQTAMQRHWDTAVRERRYAVVVEGTVAGHGDTVTSWLKENKIRKMYSSRIPGDGQRAVTHYQVLRTNARYSFLEVRLETGRKNQIRVHMQDIGHPVTGDAKYGAAHNPIGRLCLHAQVLSFSHPMTGEELRFESPVPKRFLQLV